MSPYLSKLTIIFIWHLSNKIIPMVIRELCKMEVSISQWLTEYNLRRKWTNIKSHKKREWFQPSRTSVIYSFILAFKSCLFSPKDIEAMSWLSMNWVQHKLRGCSLPSTELNWIELNFIGFCIIFQIYIFMNIHFHEHKY